MSIPAKMNRKQQSIQAKQSAWNLVEDIFPKEDRDAEERFKVFSSKDPYPDIKPALLNSADILKYVTTTGMIYPFNYEYLEGASYDVRLAGKVVYWDEDGKKIVKNIVEKPEKEDEVREFTLAKNSIAFVTLEPMFRIPDYLALRFNLKISHIYKGLLLGTGPLVDPGFVGRLSIPLHNLTANSYKFSYGDGMIQLEFTKLSMADEFTAPKLLYGKKYVIKKPVNYICNNIPPQRDVEDYIYKAVSKAITNGNGDSIVKSAIPETINEIKKESSRLTQETKDTIKDANELTQETKDAIRDVKESQRAFETSIKEENERATNLNKISIFAVAAMIITIITLSFNTLKTLEDANQRNAQEVTMLTEEYEKLSEGYKELLDKYTILEKNYTSLEKNYHYLKDTYDQNMPVK